MVIDIREVRVVGFPLPPPKNTTAILVAVVFFVMKDGEGNSNESEKKICAAPHIFRG